MCDVVKDATTQEQADRFELSVWGPGIRLIFCAIMGAFFTTMTILFAQVNRSGWVIVCLLLAVFFTCATAVTFFVDGLYKNQANAYIRSLEAKQQTPADEQN